MRSWLPLSSAETDEFLAWVVDTIHATLCRTVLVGIIQGFMGGLSETLRAASGGCQWTETTHGG